jgi:hypothetical protein
MWFSRKKCSWRALTLSRKDEWKRAIETGARRTTGIGTECALERDEKRA